MGIDEAGRGPVLGEVRAEKAGFMEAWLKILCLYDIPLKKCNTETEGSSPSSFNNSFSHVPSCTLKVNIHFASAMQENRPHDDRWMENWKVLYSSLSAKFLFAITCNL